MKKIIDNNKISIKDIQISAVGIISEVAAVKAVRPSYVMDANGKKTEQIECIRYECMNPSDLSCFTLKVLSIKPVITQEELDDSEEIMYISIPVNETLITPYKIEYGTASVSIVCPYVKRYTDDSKGGK